MTMFVYRDMTTNETIIYVSDDEDKQTDEIVLMQVKFNKIINSYNEISSSFISPRFVFSTVPVQYNALFMDMHIFNFIREVNNSFQGEM